MPLAHSQITFAKQILKSFRDTYSSGRGADTLDLGLRDAVLTLVITIEAAAPPNELSTISPNAADVTEASRLGDHLYITRKHFGLSV